MAEADGEGDKSGEGESLVNVESNLDDEAAEATEDGSFWGGWVFLLGRGISGWIGIDCIHRLYCGRLVGVSFRVETGLYLFAPVCLEKLDFYALAGRMG